MKRVKQPYELAYQTLCYAEHDLIATFHNAHKLTITTNVGGAEVLKLLSADGPNEVVFSESELHSLFQPHLIQRLRRSYPPIMNAGSLFSDENQVSQALRRVLKLLARHHLEASELYFAHSSAFDDTYFRIRAMDTITRKIAWDKVKKRMEEVLKESFRRRYDCFEPWLRRSKLENEALVIGMRVLNSARPKEEFPDGLIFEQKCAEELRRTGHQVDLTPRSGDFGVDILARKEGLTYAIQCKCYSMPVGVSSVQEVAAGRTHYTTDCAVVIAPLGFTAQAQKLALSNAVLLIGPSQIVEIEALVRLLL